MAGSGVLSLHRDADLYQGEEERSSSVLGVHLGCFKSQVQMYPQRLHLDQASSQAGRSVKWCAALTAPTSKPPLNLLTPLLELNILTLGLSVAELPQFHLQFRDKQHMEIWRRTLVNIDQIEFLYGDDDVYSGADDDDYATTTSKGDRRVSTSGNSSYGAARSNYTAPTEYTSPRSRRAPPHLQLPASMHVPLDIVIVVPMSSSMQGLKVSLLRDVLRFLVANLGEQDRMGLVTFGSSGGSMPIVGMTSKAWSGWPKVLESIRPVGQKILRADVVDGANIAMDLLMQRKSSNPLSSILLISDSATSDTESVDFVVSRAEAAK